MDDSFAVVVAYSGGGQRPTPTVTATDTMFSAAAAGDSLTLPRAAPGLRYDIINVGALSGNVFPLAGDKINALSVNVAQPMATNTAATFMCAVAGQWHTNPKTPI